MGKIGIRVINKIISILIFFVFVPNFVMATEPTETLIGANNEEYYYSSLHQALEDVNNNTFENANSNIENGVVSVKIEDSKKIVTLLKDCTELTELLIDDDTYLNLNGKNLNLRTNSSKQSNGFKINKNKALHIDGTIEGSKINYESNEEKIFNVFQVGGNLCINGGKYINRKNESQIINPDINFVNVEDTSIHAISINNIELNLEKFKNAVGIQASPKLNNSKINVINSKIDIKNTVVEAAFYKGNANLTLENSEINVNSQEAKSYGLRSELYGNILIKNNDIEVTSEGGMTIGIYSKGNTNIENLNLKSICREKYNQFAYGLYSIDDGIMNVKNSNVMCDAPANNYSNNNENKTSSSAAIVARGRKTDLYNVNVKSTDYGVDTSVDSKLYVDGGIIQTYGHGPFYFANGFGENYVQNVTLISLNRDNYDGEFDTSDWSTISSCMYVGGGNNEHNSNVTVYMDNCKFKDENSTSGYFVLRGSRGEKNLKLYISNSTFEYGNTNKYRIDDSTDNVYFGVGNKWPETEPILNGIGTATKEDNIHNTEEVYSRIKKGYLELGSTQYKDVYIVGEKFDKTGLEINLVNENDTQRITDYEILNEQEELTEEQKSITIKYNELELNVPIRVFSTEYANITCGKDVYNTIDELIDSIEYIKVNDDNVDCIIKKESLLNFINENPDKEIQINGKLINGDVNCNGKIETNDYLAILRHIAAQTDPTKTKWILSEEKQAIADITKDGKIDLNDVIKIKRYIAAKNDQNVANAHPKWLNI